jgi:hypothetical protein
MTFREEIEVAKIMRWQITRRLTTTFVRAAQAGDSAADRLSVAARAARLRQRLGTLAEAAPQAFASEVETRARSRTDEYQRCGRLSNT